MKVTYDRQSTRVRKARVRRLIQSKPVLILYKAICVLFAIVGITLMISGSQLGALFVAAAAAILILLLWYYGDLSQLPASLPGDNTDELRLEQALDSQILTKLNDAEKAEDIWRAIKGTYEQRFFRTRFGLEDSYFEQQMVAFHMVPDEIWSAALDLTKRHGLQSISPAVVTVAIFLHTPQAKDVMNAMHLEQSDLEDGLDWVRHLEDTIESIKSKEHYGGIGRDWAAGYTPLLNRVAHNLSLEIQHGGLYVRPTSGHDQAVNQMLQVLSKSRSSSVALVGELGVGKTTAVYVLAKRLLTEKVPALRYHQLFTLDASTLIASSGNYQSLEQLLLGLFSEAASAGNIIIFLDEAQLFMRSGTGSIDLTNILLQVLQSGRVHLICAMTPQEWQLLTTSNAALAGLLNYQIMPVPVRDEALQIMQDQLVMIEYKHNVVFTYQAIVEAYRLADKYVHDLAFPGRGIQIMEGAAVFAKQGLITPEIVGQSLEAKLGVKVVQATAAEGQQLLNLEDELHKRMINQNHAVGVVSDALRRARSGVNNPDRPVGTFLFLGPTGVGKTELAKALADVYFGGRDRIVRVNLNEYSQSSDVERLLVTTTTETSNALLPAIRRQPYSVVLLDEIEKAHPEVLNVLLQLLDEGVIRDTSNREASFKDAIVIATSNAGADIIRQQIEGGHNLEEFEEQFTNQLIDSGQFKPEFLNRFDEIVLFRPLKSEELEQVVSLMIEEVNKTLERQKVRVVLSDAAIKWLVDKGNDPRLGARPMRRMVQRSVENIVAKKILSGQAGPGSEITLDVPDLEAAGQ